MAKTYSIREYGAFICNKELQGYTTLPEQTFNQLETFILSNCSKGTDAIEMMSISARKGIGKIITAKNYVGVISMKDGTSIEILPKIYSREEDNEEKTKKLLIKMLKCLNNYPFKSFQTTKVDMVKMNVFEVFIRMFINEVFIIVKHGLKKDYETIEENSPVLKGKLVFQKQIMINCGHKEKCYIAHDEFSDNRAENKLIKSTLQYLYGQTISSKNKNDLKLLLNAFQHVHLSKEYKCDFEKCSADRNMKDYAMALTWCKVFLLGKSFSSFTGSEVAYALLFPMESLFEAYIAAQLKRSLDAKAFSFSAQDKRYYLFDLPNKRFRIKPDIVIKRRADGEVFVLDTKWKILSESKANYGISQADMYQMYAYQKKYHAKSVTLLYPMTEQLSIEKSINYVSQDGVIVSVRFLDLYNLQESVNAIKKQMLELT